MLALTVAVAGCSAARVPELIPTGPLGCRPRPLFWAFGGDQYRGGPTVIVWETGEIWRSRSRTRHAKKLAKGQLSEENLNRFRSYLEDNRAEIRDADAQIVLHCDCRSEGFGLFLEGEEIFTVWFHDYDYDPVLVEVIRTARSLLPEREAVVRLNDPQSDSLWLVSERDRRRACRAPG